MDYQTLWLKICSLAQVLEQAGLPKQRVLIACQSPRNFVLAFFACALVNAVAVPCPLPRRKSLTDRLQLIAHDCTAHAVIGDSDDVQSSAALLLNNPLLTIDLRQQTADLPHPMERRPDAGRGDAIVFLQYTSGSTGAPKGVAVTTDNLLHNCATIQERMALSEDSAVLIALPLFHDMGLVGGVLQAIYTGCTTGFLSPSELVQYPERWLQIISAYRITVTGGPNFIYDLTTQAVLDGVATDIDLSSLQVAFCGAEPIRPATIAKFINTMQPYGFTPRAFYPCYGMAESTLFITGGQPESLPLVCDRTGAAVMACGMPGADTVLAIVHPDTLELLPDGQVGEIWVHGSSVSPGYWAQATLTQQVFQARLAHDDPRPFLRTGDLGYLEHGVLFVCGRLKDLVIANGKKYAPQDIESEAEHSHAALRFAGGAAFSVAVKGEDRLVIVFELKRTWLRRQSEYPAIVQSIRAGIRSAVGLSVDEIMLIKPGSLPRTSSGKVKRTQCRLDYLEGRLHPLGVAPGQLAKPS
jgi:acyl-CoA synthetase (AMP-forming)/AMP-acid ligase II